MAYKFQRGSYLASGSLVQQGGDITANGSNNILAKAMLLESDVGTGGTGNLTCATLTLDGGGVEFDAPNAATSVEVRDASDNPVAGFVVDVAGNVSAGALNVGKAANNKFALGVAETTTAAKGGTAIAGYMFAKDNGNTTTVELFAKDGSVKAKSFQIGTGNSTIGGDLTVKGNLAVEGSLFQTDTASPVLIDDQSARIADAAADLANSVDSGLNFCAEGAHGNGGAIRYIDDSDTGGAKVFDGRGFVFAIKNANNFDADMAGSTNLPDSRLAALKASVFYGNGDNISNMPTTAVTTHTANGNALGGLNLVDLSGGSITLTLPDGDGLAGGQIIMFKIITTAASASRKLTINTAASNVVLEEGGDISTFDVNSDFAGVSVIQGSASTAAKRKWSIH